MTNWELLEFIWFVCNKEQHGDSFNAADFNKLAPIVQQQFYDDERSQYERTQIVTNAIERMKTSSNPDLSINSSGVAALPANYYYWGGCYYVQTIGSTSYNRPIARVTDGEYVDRMGSSIVIPTAKNPICVIRNGNIQFEPLRSAYAKFNYLRYPTRPVIDFYIDENNNQVYKAEGATATIIIKGDTYSQISNLVLNGITEDNSDYYNLYWEIVLNISTLLYEFNIYKDSELTSKVAYATTAASGNVTINEYDNSNITGTATLTISTIDIVEDGSSFLSSIVLIGNNYSRLYFSIYYDLTLNKSYLNVYSNYSKTSLVSQGELTGYTGSTVTMVAKNSSGISGNSILSGNIHSVSPNSDDYISDIFITGLYASNSISIEYQYSLTTKELTVSIYLSATLICYETFSNFTFGTTIDVDQYNSSGHSTSMLVDVKKEGDTYNQISAIELSGINATNSNSGNIYYDINDTYINLYSHYNSEIILNSSTLYWYGLCQNPVNDDVYAIVFNGGIYKQSGGVNSFATLGQTTRSWAGICSTADGDIYASVNSGDIYKQTGGIGDFTALSQTSRAWRGMCSNSAGDVYACVIGGDIYKQTGGTGDFIALSQTSRNWHGMCAAPNGDIYASVEYGDIYKQTGGTGNFIALGISSRNWMGLSAASNGDIYACARSDGFYKQTGGTGNFTLVKASTRTWRSVLVTSNNDIYGCGDGLYIYMNPIYSDYKVASIPWSTGTLAAYNSSGLVGEFTGTYSTPVLLRSANYLDFSTVTTIQTLASTYINGNVSSGNYIDFNQDNSDDNVITSVTASSTVEMEWRDEDKIRIAGRMIEAIGINLKDNSILQYAQQYKLPIR